MDHDLGHEFFTKPNSVDCDSLILFTNNAMDSFLDNGYYSIDRGPDHFLYEKDLNHDNCFNS